MTTLPSGYLRKPVARGVMAPHAVSDMLDTIAELDGDKTRSMICRHAAIPLNFNIDAPVRQETVARLQNVVRTETPWLWEKAARISGRKTAQALIDAQFSHRGRSMLSSSPWPIGAWLLGRWAQQNAWTFAGSGRFAVTDSMIFEITDNPLTKGLAQDDPACSWHASLFGHMFRRLIDSRLVCRELRCSAQGHDACQFVFYMDDELVTAQGPAHQFTP